MYPWPGKLLVLVVPLVGAGPAPPCILFLPPAVAQFRCSRWFKCLPLLGCQILLRFSLAQPQGASVLRPAVHLAVVPRSPNAAAPSESGAIQLRWRQRRDPDQR